MIHLTEEQIENLKMIKNIIDERIKDADLKFKSNRKGYTFWCPKDMNEEKTKQGYTFYAYGGRVLDLYYYFSKKKDGTDKAEIKYSIFDKDYEKYDSRIKGVRDILANRQGNLDVRLNRLLTEIGDYEWNIVMETFEKWAKCPQEQESSNNKASTNKKKTHYERMRETAIANRNSDYKEGNIKIIEMESRICDDNQEINGKKPDLIGVYKDGDEIYFCYIEYKCTTAAMDGNQSPVKHYQVMRSCYTCKPEYFKSYDKRTGKPIIADLKSLDGVMPQILFVFSHIRDNDNNKLNPCMTFKKAKNSLDNIKKEINKDSVTYNHIKDNVKVLIISDETEELRIDKLMTVEEAIAKLEND